MFMILIIAFTCALTADEYHNLGQSPRSATIFKRSTTEYMATASIMPSTMIPRPRIDEIGLPIQQQDILATNHNISIGTLHHLNAHIDLSCSIGAQINAGRFYVPILLEGRLYPVKGKIRPFLAAGFGGMVSLEFGLFSVRGAGLNVKLSKQLNADLQYRQIRGDVFFFEAKHPMHTPYNQVGVQLGMNLLF